MIDEVQKITNWPEVIKKLWDDQSPTDLIKNYIELYEGAFLFRALSKFSTNALNRKTSSPKILPLCPALFTVTQGLGVVRDAKNKGRIFELVVGSELNRLPGELSYWREGVFEVDYIYVQHGKVYAIEVKSGQTKSHDGLAQFTKKFPRAREIIITPKNFAQFSKDAAGFLRKLTSF